MCKVSTGKGQCDRRADSVEGLMGRNRKSEREESTTKKGREKNEKRRTRQGRFLVSLFLCAPDQSKRGKRV